METSFAVPTLSPDEAFAVLAALNVAPKPFEPEEQEFFIAGYRKLMRHSLGAPVDLFESEESIEEYINGRVERVLRNWDALPFNYFTRAESED